MMYSQILRRITNERKIKDVCISVDCRDIVYPFSFIRGETDDYLIIDSTGDDGFERVVIIPKENILSISMVYEQDIDKLFTEEEKSEMFQ